VVYCCAIVDRLGTHLPQGFRWGTVPIAIDCALEIETFLCKWSSQETRGKPTGHPSKCYRLCARDRDVSLQME